MSEREAPPLLAYRHKDAPTSPRTDPAESAQGWLSALLLVFASATTVLLVFVLAEPHRGNLPGQVWVGLAAAGLLMGVVALYRRLHRRRAGTIRYHAILYCDGCGYDLRHSTGRCPECGR